MTTVQSTMRATLLLTPYDSLIASNLHDINILHFMTIDESVNANPRFCPLFGSKGGHYGLKSPHFCVF